MRKFAWLNDTAIFAERENEVYLYLGTAKEPRTSIIKINELLFSQPIRIPPTSVKGLEERHLSNKLKIEEMQINAKFKYILEFFISRQNGKKHKGFELKTYQVKKYDQEIKLEKILNEVPKNLDFTKWIEGKKFKNQKTFDAFIRIISRSNRYSRQRALTDLVIELDGKNKTPLSGILLLIGIREEITIAIFRELARQNKFYPLFTPIVEFYFQETESEDLRWYSFLYLLKSKPSTVYGSPLYKNLLIEGTIFSSLSTQDRLIYINNKLIQDSKTSKIALLGLIELNKHSPQSLSNFVFQYHLQFSLSLENKDNYRIAILQLTKIMEFIHEPKILGALLGFSSIKRTSIIEKERGKPQKLLFNHGPLYFVLKYGLRRIFKLFEVWDKVGLSNLTDQALSFYAQYFPPENFVSAVDKIERDIVLLWGQKNPILDKYSRRIFQRFMDHPDELFNALITQIGFNNELYLRWLDVNIRSRFLQAAIELATNDQLLLFYINPLPPKLSRILNKLLTNFNQDATSELSLPLLLDNQLEKALRFFRQTSIFMPENIFEQIMENFFVQKFRDKEGIIDYLSNLNHNANYNLSRIYFNIIYNKIEEYGYQNIENDEIRSFCTDFLLEWDKITFHKLDDDDQEKLTSIKILFEKHLTANKPNTWDILSVETITSVYKLQNLEIGSFIDGSVQYAMNKPNWEQLARHFLALGLVRPKREALGKSKLKEVPKFILRDIEGQIALITETILYCERNGFSPGLENLIIQNIYKRGWNIDRTMVRKLPGIFGNVTPRLRAYIAAFYILDQGEVGTELLKYARNIDNYALRERLARTLERFGTPDIWFTLSESIYQDISEESLKQFSQSRMSIDEKIGFIIKLLASHKLELRQLGIKWLSETEVPITQLIPFLNTTFSDIHETIIDLILGQFKKLKDDELTAVFDFGVDYIWKINVKNILVTKILNVLTKVDSKIVLDEDRKNRLELLAESNISNRASLVLRELM